MYPVGTKQKVHDFEYTERYDKIGEVYYALIRYILKGYNMKKAKWQLIKNNNSNVKKKNIQNTIIFN